MCFLSRLWVGYQRLGRPAKSGVASTRKWALPPAVDDHHHCPYQGSKANVCHRYVIDTPGLLHTSPEGSTANAVQTSQRNNHRSGTILCYQVTSILEHH